MHDLIGNKNTGTSDLVSLQQLKGFIGFVQLGAPFDGGSSEICIDKVDNDGDWAVDCVDPDCMQGPDCVMSPYGAQVTALEACNVVNYLRHMQKTSPR